MAYQKKSYEERKAELDKAFNDIAENVPKVFESEGFKKYLDFASSFHTYSINNQILIRLQKPEASLVAGYRSWQEKGRQVNKGEKGIRILAPSSYKKKEEVNKLDAYGKPIIGADGNPEKEIRDVTVSTFTTVAVFDVSQTSGEPIPEPIHNLEGNSKEALNLLESVEMVCDSPISYKTGAEDPELKRANGYFDRSTGEIVVSAENDADQQAKTLVHEWAHALLHQSEDKSPDQKEIEAEATAYVVSKHFGLDTGDYSFGYVGTYAVGKDVDELKDVLNGIRNNAHEMINKIEDVFEQVQEKNKNIDVAELLENRGIKVAEEAKTEPETTEHEEPETPENTGTDKDLLLTAMKAAGYEYDEINSSEGNMRFMASETYELLYMKDWNEVEEWLNGVVFDDPDVSNAVEKILHPDRFDEDGKKKETESEKAQPEKTEPKKEEMKKEELEKKETANSGKIEDFGEKIGGAKKDLWKQRGLTLYDYDSMNEAERKTYVKKNSIWPTPDYKAIMDSGVPREVVYYMKLVRDKVSTAPISNKAILMGTLEDEQKRYINFVSDLKEHVMAVKSMSDIEKLHDFFKDEGYIKRDGLFYSPTEKAGRYVDNKLNRAVQISPEELRAECRKKEFLMTEEEKILNKFNVIPFVLGGPLRIDEEHDCLLIKSSPFSSTYLYPQGAVDATGKTEKCSSVKDMKEGTYMIVSGNHIVAVNIESEEKAKKYVLDSYGEVKKEVKEEKKRKDALKPGPLDNIKREGPEYRTDHATGQDYLDTFAFRGGEFGNWLNENERQQNLDMGYDAFKDLGKALGITDKDVALDGRLSIAFGARGSGKALAHYEPMREVINLTKLKGAGTLGHEWTHAMDDILGKRLGFEGMLSENNNYRNRDVIPETFRELMNTIKHRTLTAEESLQASKTQLDENCEQFRNGLLQMSKEGSTPALEAKRQELIEAVVDEARKSYDFSMHEISDKGRMQENTTPSPAYQKFIDFQKEQGDNNPDSKQNRRFAAARRDRIGGMADKIDNHPNQIRTQQVETNFYKDAMAIDNAHSKAGHGYWSSDCELLARAGAVYIADKCKEAGIVDDYLSGHAESWTTERPLTAPEGEERKAINMAFDNFFEEMRERGLFTSLDGGILENVMEQAEQKQEELVNQAATKKPPVKEPKKEPEKENKDGK